MRRSTRNTARAAHVGLFTASSNSKRTASPMKDKTSSQRVKSSLDPPRENSPPLPGTVVEKVVPRNDERRAEKKWLSWVLHATSSPYPDFDRPARQECESAHRVLEEMHQEAVDEEFKYPNTPETISFVFDAMIAAVLSQATSWSNAKRAMNSMKEIYGSVFAYDKIVTGGLQKLQDTIHCGGLHIRKSLLIMSMFEQVWERHGKWDLDYLFKKSDEDAMQELMRYMGMGPKSAFVRDELVSEEKSLYSRHAYRPHCRALVMEAQGGDS